MFPELKKQVLNIEDKQLFTEDEMTVKALHTPGHVDDHMSFQITQNGQTYLFSGDIILGSPSLFVNDMGAFLRTLKTLHAQDDPVIDWICLPHSLHPTDPNSIIIPARQKIEQYIEYRENSLQILLNSFKLPVGTSKV